MYDGQRVIDVHGHMSTPPHFRAFAYNMIALRSTEGSPNISDQLMQTALDRHLRIMDERNIDVQMISPRPVAMMHWETKPLVKRWTEVTNDVIYQQPKMHSDRYVGVAQLPQHQSVDTNNCLVELDRCVQEMNFVGALVNPDPGADRLTPGMDQDYWFPLYKRAAELQVPLIVHPAIIRDPRLENIPHSYQYNNLTEESLAKLLLEHSDVFERFPSLMVVIAEGGFAWLPDVMWRLDKDWRSVRDEVPWVKRLPSEYILDRVRFTTQPFPEPDDPEQLRAICEIVQAERTLLFSSDYPHWDFDNPLTAFSFFPADLKQRIFVDNAVELYGERLLGPSR